MSYIDSHEPQPWIGEEFQRKWTGTQYGRDGYTFAQAGASNIVDRFGLGDTGSPRRKRGRGMSAALGVI